MKSILALILLAVVAQSAIVKEETDYTVTDIVLESLNIEVDWPQLLRCLEAAHPVVKDVVSLIKIIKAKNLDEAIKIVQRLLDEGNQLIKSCKGAIHKKNKVNLGVNFHKLLQFILAASSKIPQIQDLINAIKSKDYLSAGFILLSLKGEAKELINTCKL